MTTPPAPQHGKVRGVIDPSGKIPVADNPVTLVAQDGSKLQQTSSADGSFVFADVLPGTYYLDLKLPGFAPLLVPSIVVHSGEQVDLGTEAPTWLGSGSASQGLIDGVVVVNGGGDANGGSVEFLLQPVNQRVALAAVGVGGIFTQAVPPGTYNLRVSHPLYVTAEQDGVVVGDGQTLDLTHNPIALDLNPARLTGNVLEERDGLTPIPAAGALVTLSDGATTTCDADGDFVLSGLPAGTQTLRITAAGFHDTGAGRVVQLFPGQATALTSSVTLALDRGTIAGTIQISDQQPATDVEVALTGTAYNALVSPDPANPSHGSFQIQNVPVGVYEVSVSKAKYTRATAGSVSVLANQTQTLSTLTLAPLLGDFEIDDADPTNTPGYSSSPSVTLNLSGFGSAVSYRASEDPTFTGVPFSPFTGSTQPFTLASQDGTHTVYAQYMDAASTVSATFSATIVLDSSAPAQPAIVVDSGAAFTATASPLYLTLQAQDPVPSGADTVSGLAMVRINETGASTGGLLDASPVPYQRDLAYLPTTSGDGPRTVYVQFVDHAGNASAIVSSTVTIDTQPPSGSIAIADGAGATSSGLTRSPMVTLSSSAAAEPNGGFVLIRLANSQAALATAVFQPLSASSTWFLDASSDGAKTVWAELQDAAGNRTSSPLNANITLDTTPPSPAQVTLAGPAITRSRIVDLNLSATDAVGLSPTQAVTVSLDPFFLAAGTVGPEAFPFSSQLGFDLGAGEPDGPKQIDVRYRDAAGNDTVTSVRVTLDTTPPSGTMTLVGTLGDGSASSTNTAIPSVLVQLSQSGATRYALGNEILTDCSSATYQPLNGASTLATTLSGSASPREVHLCLADDAGNTFGPLVQTISLDGTAPTGCALALAGSKVDGSPAPAGKTATAGVTVTVSSCNETPTEIFLTSQPVTCTANGAFAWQPFSASLTGSLPGPDGTNTIYGCVRDAARNTGSLAQASITLDTQGPSAPQLTLDNGASYVNAAQVASRGGQIASALGQANGATEWALSESSNPSSFVAFSGAAQGFTFSSGDGAKRLYAVFRDDVGNVSPVVSATITFDTAAPDATAASVSVPGNGFTASPAVSLVLTGPADAAGLQLANAASPGACAAADFASAAVVPFTVSAPFTLASGDGLKRICARVLDAAGNPSAIFSTTVTLDTAAPTGCALSLAGRKVDGSAAPSGKTASANVTTAISGCSETPTDLYLTSASSVTCSAGASLAWQPFSASGAFTLAGPDGANTVRGCVRDAAGNVGSLTAGSITLDTQAPTAPQLTLDNGASYVNAAQVASRGGQIASALGQATGATEWALSESSSPSSFVAFTGAATNFTFSAGDGLKHLYAVFRDDVGNVSAVVSTTITFDTVAPVTTAASVSVAGNGFTGTPAVTLSLAGPSDAAQLQLATAASSTACATSDFGAITAQPFAVSAPFTLSSGDGLKRICARVLDAAGNPSAIFSTTVTLDTAAPTGCALALSGRKVDGSAAPSGKTASANVTTAISGCSETPADMFLTSAGSITCSAGAALAWQPFSASGAFTLAGPDGANTVRGCVRDQAGNVGSLTAASISLDTQAPTAPQLTLDSGALYVNAAQVASRGGQIASALGQALGATEWALSESSNPSNFVAFSGAAQNFTFSAGDGSKRLYAVFRDDVGNTSAVVSTTITFDTAAPDVSTASVSVPGSGFTGTPGVTLALSGPSDAAQLQLANAASSAACATSDFAAAPTQAFAVSAPFTLSSGDGLKRICARVLDVAGNPSAIFSTTATLDTAAPTGCALSLTGRKVDGSAAPAGKTATANVTAAITSCNETPAELYLTSAGSVTCSAGASLAWQPFSASSAYSLSGPDGTNTVRGCVRDAAGNVGSLTAASITLDTQAPSAPQISIDSGAAYVNAAAVASRGGQIGSALGQATGATEWALSESSNPTSFVAFSGAAQNFTFSAGDGLKHLYAVFRDDVGNVSAVVSTSITFDTVAPDTTAASVGVSGNGFTGTPAVTLALAGPSDAAQMQLSTAASSTACATSDFASATSIPFAVSSPFTLSSGDGLKRICARVLDAAGNPSSIFSTTVSLDTTVPTGCALALSGRKVDGSAAPSGKTATANVTVAISSCSETPTDLYLTSAASVTCSASASLAWQPFAASSSFTVPGPDGVNTVRGCVRDAAGNVGSLTAGSITLDTAAPSAPQLTLDSGALYVNAAAVASRGGQIASALGQATGATEWALSESSNPSSFVTFSGTAQNFTFSAGDGLKHLYAVFRDDVGNLSQVVSASITFDTVAPDASSSTVSVSGNGYTNHPNVTLALSGPSDAAQMQLATAASSTACATSDFATAPMLTWAVSSPLNMPPGDGTKRVCARVFDAAGNPSSIFSTTVILDTAAPGNCTLALVGRKVDGTTAPAGKTASTSITVNISGCTETPADLYLASGAVSCAPTSSFAWQPFTASSSLTIPGPDGPNPVNGCVRDSAGNIGPITGGTIMLDTQPPNAPFLTIDNGALYVNASQVASRGGTIATVAGQAGGATQWAVQQSSDFTSATFTAFPATNPKSFTFAGSGVQTVYAVFRDDVGNTSTVASASINFDVTPPDTTSASLTVLSPTNNGFTNNVSTIVQLTAPSDAVQVKLGMAGNPVSCVDADVDLSPPKPVQQAYGMLLPPGDGQKRVCAKLIDPAGNISGLVSGTITLDTTPPAVPVIQTASQVLNAPDNALLTVQTVAPNGEPDFARYEQLGGKLSSWTPAPGGIGNTSFNFNLLSSNSAPAGVANVLRLRAVDQAGNASPEASVVITTDVVAPQQVTVSLSGVTNKDGAGTVYWLPNPANTDVAGYNVYYGSASGAYTGTYATEGNSPIRVGSTASSLSLSGLSNGAITYVTVRPVDFAGNEGPAPGYPSELMLEPNKVAPTQIAQANLSFAAKKVLVHGDYAYILGPAYYWNCTPSSGPGPTGLEIRDLSGLVSPVQHGQLNPSVAPPPVVTTLSWNDGLPCDSGQGVRVDMVADGPWLFIGSGTKVRMLDVTNPLAPVEAPPVDLSAQLTQITALTLDGTTLFVHGLGTASTQATGTLLALDVSSLSDGAPGTPTTANLLGPVHNTFTYSAGAAISRNWLVQGAYNYGGYPQAVDVTNATDNNPGTPFDDTVRRTVPQGPSFNSSAPPLVSGNILYSTSYSGFTAYNLSPLWTWSSGPAPVLTQVGSDVSATGGADFDISGGQALVVSNGSTPGIAIDDLTNLTSTGAVTEQSVFQQDYYVLPVSIATYGPYLLEVSYYDFTVLELSSSTGFNVESTISHGSGASEIRGGFMYGATGSVIDLQAGWPAPDLNSGPDSNVFAGALLNGDRMLETVSPNGGTQQLRVADLTKFVDRNPATNYNPATDSYAFNLTGVAKLGEVKTWGNFAVVTEVLTSGTPGTYLEVFDIRKARNYQGGQQLSAADSLGRFQVSTYNSTTETTYLTLAHGRAVVSIDDTNEFSIFPTMPNGVVIYDLRPMVRDSARGPAVFQGSLPLKAVRQTAVVGNRLYAASLGNNLEQCYQGAPNPPQGFTIWDISAAMDEDNATTVTAGAPLGSLTIDQALAITAYGNYVYLATNFPNGASCVWGTYAIDVSDSANPRIIGHSSVTGGQTEGTVSVHGSRLYVTGWGNTSIITLQ